MPTASLSALFYASILKICAKKVDLSTLIWYNNVRIKCVHTNTQTHRSGDGAERSQCEMKRGIRSGRGRNFYTSVLKNFGHRNGT